MQLHDLEGVLTTENDIVVKLIPDVFASAFALISGARTYHKVRAASFGPGI
jgi:hypothetical protein